MYEIIFAGNNLNNKRQNINQNNSIILIRVFAMVLILACHIVQEHSNEYIKMTAQFLNVGVSIFILISGYLYGTKKINENYVQWIIKRAKRILIPLYIFMAYLLIIYLIKGINISIFNWIAYILNLQGFQIYIHGAEHLWYLTVIMICYTVTPILDRNKKKLNKKNIKILIPILIFIQVLTTYFINTQIGIYLIYILLYIISYIVGNSVNISISNKKIFLAFGIGIISITIRLIGKFLLDDTRIYNVIIVGYTQAIIAFSIFYIFAYLGNKFKANSVIKYIDSISFEVYLVHYMYMVGPVRFMGLTNSFILNTIITIIASVITAILLKKICKKFYFLMDGIKINKIMNKSSSL